MKASIIICSILGLITGLIANSLWVQLVTGKAYSLYIIAGNIVLGAIVGVICGGIGRAIPKGKLTTIILLLMFAVPIVSIMSFVVVYPFIELQDNIYITAVEYVIDESIPWPFNEVVDFLLRDLLH